MQHTLADTNLMPCQCAWKLVGWDRWEAQPAGGHPLDALSGV